MSIDPTLLDVWFTYHAPTEHTLPRYAAIRAAEATCASVSTAILNGGWHASYSVVNATCRRFVEVIDENCPESADKTAAIRCVRLARNALNEALTILGSQPYTEVPYVVSNLCRVAEGELQKARWQACSAVACAVTK